MVWKVIQTEINPRTVRLYQIGEGVFSAGTAFAPCHGMRTFHHGNGAEYFIWNAGGPV
jgi:hypothetical protein